MRTEVPGVRNEKVFCGAGCVYATCCYDGPYHQGTTGCDLDMHCLCLYAAFSLCGVKTVSDEFQKKLKPLFCCELAPCAGARCACVQPFRSGPKGECLCGTPALLNSGQAHVCGCVHARAQNLWGLCRQHGDYPGIFTEETSPFPWCLCAVCFLQCSAMGVSCCAPLLDKGDQADYIYTAGPEGPEAEGGQSAIEVMARS
eukprot:FR739138.1.p1 GENE.FR739138.1~~FR739138.1.p1  ORF type:complete len:212 (+),score=14.42 FR739138.1:38-637(+)